MVLSEERKRQVAVAKPAAILGSNTCGDQHGKFYFFESNISIRSFPLVYMTNLFVCSYNSTINYGSELPLAQGINFG